MTDSPSTSTFSQLPHDAAHSQAATLGQSAVVAQGAALVQDASFASLAEIMPVPVMAATSSGIVVCLNSNARFLFDHHTPLTEATSIEDVVGSGSAQAFRGALESTLAHGSALIPELPPTNQFLKDMNFVLTTALLKAGEETVVVFTLREVSSGLELTRLQEKDRVQDYMFRALVHDLRTPLSAISSGTQYLETEIPAVEGQAGQDIQEVLQVLQYSCSQVEGLLEDLGELVEYHINPSGSQIEVVDLENLTNDILDMYRVRGLQHGFEFTVDGAATVHGMTQRLTRAIDNLVSNAVKYSPHGGTIRLHIGPDPRDVNRVQLSIADEGIGMDPAQLRGIWEPFARLHNEDTAEIDGTGLGLSIVRFVIENHGGNIDVESARGQGTTFVISLPRGN